MFKFQYRLKRIQELNYHIENKILKCIQMITFESQILVVLLFKNYFLVTTKSQNLFKMHQIKENMECQKKLKLMRTLSVIRKIYYQTLTKNQLLLRIKFIVANFYECSLEQGLYIQFKSLFNILRYIYFINFEDAKKECNPQIILQLKLDDKSQITLFSVLYIAFCILLTTTLLVIFLNFSKESLTNSTLTMERIETINQMSRYNTLQTQSFNRVLNFSYNTLSKIDKLNHFIEIQALNNFIITQPTNCIDNPNLWDKYIFNCSLCYKFCNKTKQIDEQDYQQYFQLISLITQSLPILNLYRQTFFTSTSYEQFFTVYRGGNYTKFVAHIRPWYINHINRTKYENHKFFLSDLYLDWINKLAIAFTVSLTNLQGEMIGVIGYDLAFDLLPYFLDQRLKMEIVNSTGHLLVSSYYEEYKYPTVIYNTTLTGFTEYDWQKMKQFGDNDNIGRGTLRVKNRRTMEFNEISVYKMNYPEFYIIMYLCLLTSYQTDDQFIKDQQLILNNLAKFDEQILLGTIYFSLIILFSVLMIQFLIIKYVLSHLESLVLITKQQIFLKQRIKNKSIAINPDKDNTISKLCRSFLKLNQNLTNFKWKKSKLCRTIQKIKYPRTYCGVDQIMIENFNKQIKESSQYLEDNQDENYTCLRTGLFKRLVCQNKYQHWLFIQKYGTQ